MRAPGRACPRVRVRTWPVVVCLGLLAACLPTGPDFTQVRYPSTPAGKAIASVVDVPLPNGVLAYSGSRTVDPSVAIDDQTGALYVLGVPRDGSTRASALATYADAIYRIDPKTQTYVKVAGLTLGDEGALFGVAATNGWLFWVESSVTGPDTRRRVHFAAKSDGSNVMRLSDSTEGIDDPDEPVGAVVFRGFTAGSGTAMWFGDLKKGGPVHVFDTATATARVAVAEPKFPGLGQVNGDRILLWGEGDKYSMQVHSIAAGKSVPATTEADTGVLGAQALYWTEESLDSSELFGCSFVTPTGSECSDPVRLRHWDQERARVECVAGDYVVARPPGTDSGLVLINLKDPGPETPLLTTQPGGVMCGGDSVVYPWWTRVEDDNGEMVELNFVRVVTTTG